MNTFGHNLRLTTFGESHGPAIGGVLDGLPANLKIDFERVHEMIERRRPGTSPAVTARNESDTPEFLSGLDSDGVTLGTPIGFIIRNRDYRSEDYSNISEAYRPNHADYTWESRFGRPLGPGGGRASARETACRVVAGAVAKEYLRTLDIKVEARLLSVGDVSGSMEDMMAEAIRVKALGDSVGGLVGCSITGMPTGIGNPVYGKFQMALAAAIMSIPAVKGFEYGLGFEAATSFGSQTMDILGVDTNFCGGLQGGITNGRPIEFRVAFKPTPTLGIPVETIDRRGNRVVLQPKGRHDPCVAIRGVAVVEAMAALVAADLQLGSGRVSDIPF